MTALLASAAFWQAWRSRSLRSPSESPQWRGAPTGLLREAQGLLRYWEEKQDWGEAEPPWPERPR